MPIPALRPVEADVDIVRRLHQVVRKTRRADRAEDGVGFLERVEDAWVPPAFVAEFDDVSASWIERFQNGRKCAGCVAKAGRQLEEKATKTRAEQVGDQAEIAH